MPSVMAYKFSTLINIHPLILLSVHNTRPVKMKMKVASSKMFCAGTCIHTRTCMNALLKPIYMQQEKVTCCRLQKGILNNESQRKKLILGLQYNHVMYNKNRRLQKKIWKIDSIGGLMLKILTICLLNPHINFNELPDYIPLALADLLILIFIVRWHKVALHFKRAPAASLETTVYMYCKAWVKWLFCVFQDTTSALMFVSTHCCGNFALS